MYVKEKKSLRHIASALEVSHETVRTWLFQQGVEMRKKPVEDPDHALVRGLILAGHNLKYIQEFTGVGRTKITSIRNILKNRKEENQS